MDLKNMMQKASAKTNALHKKKKATSSFSLGDAFVIEDIEPLEDIIRNYESKGYNMKYVGDFLRYDGNVLAQSPAGSGKTVSIILKLLTDDALGRLSESTESNGNRFTRSKNVLVTSFTKESAADLQRTLQEESRKVGEMYMNSETRFSTLHSAYLHILEDKIGVKVNVLTDKPTMHRYLREVCTRLKIANGYPTAIDLNALLSAIGYLNNRVDWLTDNRIKDKVLQKLSEDSVIKQMGVTPYKLQELHATYQQKKEDENVYDFDDLQLLIYNYACGGDKHNPAVERHVSMLYDYIVIDEFQDVSQIQYEILKCMAKGNTTVIAVGDSNQSIYGFRGSDMNIILNRYENDFKPKTFNFKISYRCPSVILKYANTLIKHNEQKFDSDMEAYKQGGNVVAYSFEDYEEMVAGTYENIVKDINEGKSVAILVGTNFDLLPLAVYADLKNEFMFKIGGTLYSLTRNKIKNLLSVMSLMDKDCDIVDVVKQFKISYLRSASLDKMKKEMELRGYSPLEAPISFYRQVDVKLSKIMEVFIRQYRRFEDSGLSYGRKMMLLLDILRLLQDKEYIKEIMDFEPIYLTFQTIVSAYESEIHSYSEFLQVLKKVQQHLDGYAALPSNSRVIMTTIHDFKGLEADCVYGFNMVDGSLPRATALKVKAEDFKEAIEEERRLAYILYTRAREKLSLMTIADKASRFIKESGLDLICYDFEEEQVELLEDSIRKEVAAETLFSEEDDGNVYGSEDYEYNSYDDEDIWEL